MSALWSAEILLKQAAVVVVRVRQIHPESGGFPTCKAFALRLIYDEAFGYGIGLVRQSRGPLGETISLDQTFDNAYMDDHVDRFIRSVDVSEVSGAPLDFEAAQALVDREITATGAERGEPEWQVAWDEAWGALWSDATRLSAATYRIEVTESRWLDHLAPGQAWESAAYED